VSSPDAPRDTGASDAPDAFDRRIADAARSLRPHAPGGMLERIRERSDDLDASIETAARSLAGAAPIDAFDVRIAAAARELRKPVPSNLYDAIRTRSRRTRLGTRFMVLRGALALAASIVAAVFLVARLSNEAGASANPALLTDAALAQSLRDESRLDREADRLEQQVTSDRAVQASAVAQSLLEEVAFIEEAISECRDALDLSQAHGHLRSRLIELTARRVELLRRIAAE